MMGEKVILQEMKSDSYESCIADLVRKVRAKSFPDFF